MRAYFFGNQYLSSIQQSIQAAHVISEMFINYPMPADATPAPAHFLYDWAENHKTIILLNGGYSDNIRRLLIDFDDPQNPYPWEDFCESHEALDGALTCVGIVLPEKIYEGAAVLRSAPSTLQSKILTDEGTITLFSNTGVSRVEEYTKWEAKFMNKLNTFGMAK